MKNGSTPLYRGLIPQLCGLAVAMLATPASGQQKLDLQVEFDRASQCRVVVQFDHEGDVVVLKASDTTKTQPLPLKVRARMDYFQRYTGNSTENQAIRFFNVAKSEIKVDEGQTTNELTEKNRFIVTRIATESDRRMQLASIGSSLKQSELDLLRNPADPLTLAALINRKDVKEGDKWSADDTALADFLVVQRLISNDVELLLKSVDNGEAKIYLSGKARAEVDDVVTDMEVTGIVLVDLKNSLPKSIRLGLREDRERGQVAPGFVGITKVDMRFLPGKSTERLTNDSIKKLTAGKPVQQRLSWSSESGQFALQYEPKWRLIASEQEAAILRYLENGELMAQCDVVRLPSRPASNPLKLDDFKTEVAKMLSADENAQIEEAQQMRTRSGLSVLEIEVSGAEKDVPLNWIYFHVSNGDGRCVTFVFTLEEELIGQIRPAARKLVRSLKFAPAKGKDGPAVKAFKSTGQAKRAGSELR